MDDRNKPQVSIEEALMRELRFGGIDKDHLKELVSIVAGVQKAGLRRFRAFPKGTPPIVDSVSITGIVEAGEVNRLFSEILTKTPLLSKVELFPYGIPWPEIFRLNLEIGAPVQR